MQRVALVDDDGVVENVIIVGEDYEPPVDYQAVYLEPEEYVAPGFTRDGRGWRPPETPETPPAPDPGPSEVETLRADLDWLINFVITGEA